MFEIYVFMVVVTMAVVAGVGATRMK